MSGALHPVSFLWVALHWGFSLLGVCSLFQGPTKFFILKKKIFDALHLEGPQTGSMCPQLAPHSVVDPPAWNPQAETSQEEHSESNIVAGWSSHLLAPGFHWVQIIPQQLAVLLLLLVASPLLLILGSRGSPQKCFALSSAVPKAGLW